MYNPLANNSKLLIGAMLPRESCFRHFPCSGFVLTNIISVFLENTNIRRVKLLMTVNLRFDARLFHV